jgi:Asp-tRNA(Asn)/Glu-tRNA(Gln) amidotransferase C subunit
LPELEEAGPELPLAPAQGLRPDVPAPTLDRDEFLAMAPEAAQGGVRVPKVGEL